MADKPVTVRRERIGTRKRTPPKDIAPAFVMGLAD